VTGAPYWAGGGRPRLSHQESLFQGRKPAFWLFLVMVLLCGMGVAYEQLIYLASYPVAWFLSIVLLLLIGVPMMVLIYRLDYFEPEPISLVAGALLWGGVVAIFFASVANELFVDLLQRTMSPDAFEAWAAAIVAPTNEELYKGLGLVVIFLIARREINGLLDGLIYGAFIGLGFQAVENVQYFLEMTDVSGNGQVAPVLGMFFLRVLVSGLYSHTLFTGLVGIGFAYAITRLDVSRRRRALVAAGLFLAAWSAHFIWNSPLLDSLLDEDNILSFIPVALLKGLPFFVFLVLLVVLARRREVAVFSSLVGMDVGTGVLSQADIYIMSSGRRRRAARRAVEWRKGTAGRRLQIMIQRALLDLASIRARAPFPDHPAVEAQRALVLELREQLSSLPDRR
jgi:RsiW-degrading membrane proteinase PrsW (M82 family)